MKSANEDLESETSRDQSGPLLAVALLLLQQTAHPKKPAAVRQRPRMRDSLCYAGS